ncbi:DUF1616 domain-containing protein [Halalkalicoccus sp. NIPERK01]|uniref:DUF1616 domain-containing protein n=1 Tax=Halalkalicoccus sp. NIPERK01 TaxID=3053469 RepID=UPI00256EE590|nr:DUF1616 domain-containing protein [Halalkalicoccus sp. NIPERK01]MDL5360634.1 DUF1616 domain-containing protein [Halalkalicoccus sp. NIPERK01]
MTRAKRARPPDRRVPADVPIVAAFLLLANGIIAFAPWQALHVVPGLVLLLFVPGYALLTVLFPGRPDADHSIVGGIDGVERVALSFGLSVALVPLLYLIAYLFGRLNPPSTLMLFGVLNGFVVLAMLLGVVRRKELSPARRFDLPARGAIAPEVADRRTDRRGFLADIALGGAVVAAVGSLAYAISDPGDGERFTEFQLLSRTGGGEYVAGDYRTVLTAGEPQSQIVGIENHEHVRTTYTVVAELQRVDTEGDSARLLERGDRTERTVSVAPGESAYLEQGVTPDIVAENLRLAYMLYTNASPIDDPYRELHLWVDVYEPGTEPTGA